MMRLITTRKKSQSRCYSSNKKTYRTNLETQLKLQYKNSSSKVFQWTDWGIQFDILHTSVFMQLAPAKYEMNREGHTWRKQLGGAGVDDVSLRYSSQVKASEEEKDTKI